MRRINKLKYQNHAGIVAIASMVLFSCGNPKGDKKNESEEKDTVSGTDETEMIEIEEVEMKSMYEVTNTKTHKTVTMSQEEYLESAIWENPDCIIKEIPVVK